MDSPVPSVLNWDIFEHQTVINAILRGRWAPLPSYLTDTFRFDGYTTLFHTILAGAQSLIPVDPMTFWWGAESIHFLATILVSAAVAGMFLNQPFAGLIGGILGATVFESQIAYTSLFLLPQTVSATLGALAIALLNGENTKTAAKIGATLLLAASILFHFVVGGFVLALAVISHLAKHTSRHQALRFTLALTLLAPTASYMLATSIPLGAINYGEASVFTHDIGQKIAYYYQWYGPFLVFIPIGIGMALSSHNHKHRMAGLLASVSLATIMAPFPYALKFATIGRFFLNTALSLALLRIILSLRTQWAKVITISIITVSLTYVFTQNITSWKAPLLRDGKASELSHRELDAAKYLQKTTSIYSDSVMLLSDPATQYILEATSGINTQGGAYATNETRDRAAGAIRGHRKSNTLVVFSGRYFRWLEQPKNRYSLAFNIWRPEGLTLNDYIKIYDFEKQTGLTPIYQNGDLFIYSYDTQP